MKKSFENLLGNAISGKPQKQIVIDEELRGLIPPLTQDELSQLEANILAEGVRDPLVFWPVADTLVLVDGHNRFSICQKHGIDFPRIEISLKDREEVIQWMIHNQLGRRNLSLQQQSYLRGLRYNSERSQGRRSDLTSAQNEQKLTAELLAEEYNVSAATIRRDGDFAKAVDDIGRENPTLKRNILSGQSGLTKTEVAAMAKPITQYPVRKEKTKDRVNVNELAAICFRYVKTESRGFEDVCLSIGINGHINPIEFFLLWRDQNAVDK